MEINLNKIKNVHFIGIGGIGVSAIARMMLHDGKVVTGQNIEENEIVKGLRKLGIKIEIGQSFEKIPKETELIVYTVAIETYDPELFKKIKEHPILHKNADGQEQKVFVKSYPEMLGIISESKYTIAVSGTHGKTTTTGMIAKIFMDALLEPTVVIGSLLNPSNTSGQAPSTDSTSSLQASSGQAPSTGSGQGNGSNFIAGNGKYFITEACEYRRSFLNINPKILVITNVDEDHLDYYRDIEDIKSAFHEMAMRVPEDGFVVCNPNDKNISDVIDGVKAKIIDYSQFIDENLKLKIPGIHNKKNSATSEAVAKSCGISDEIIKKALSEFAGTWRRFEYKGKLSSGTLVYDDYGHTPAEIRATMQGFRELYPKEVGWKITMVFQPHLFSRTKLLLDDFAKCFGEVDELLILPIYYAREEDDGTISSEILAERVNENTHNAKSFPNFETAKKYIEDRLTDIDEKNIIVTMGAGEAYKIGDSLLNK